MLSVEVARLHLAGISQLSANKSQAPQVKAQLPGTHRQYPPSSLAPGRDPSTPILGKVSCFLIFLIIGFV